VLVVRSDDDSIGTLEIMDRRTFPQKIPDLRQQRPLCQAAFRE
jgi:hypothetical protein